jgi:hypothetical protein
MYVRFPHCRNPIELADVPEAGEISCAGCGSSFNFDPYAASSQTAPAKRLGKFEIVSHSAEKAAKKPTSFLSIAPQKSAKLEAGHKNQARQWVDRAIMDRIDVDFESEAAKTLEAQARAWWAFQGLQAGKKN